MSGSRSSIAPRVPRAASAARRERIEQALRLLLLQEARRKHWPLSRERLLELFRADIELNAQGLGVWLDVNPG